MKNEIRIAASNAAHTLVQSLPNLIPVVVAKKECYAFDTGIIDENGKPVYAVVDVTVKNTEDTKSAQAFDIEAAKQAMTDKANAPKKERKAKEADPEAEAKRAARNAMKELIHRWCVENLGSEGMTTTDIKNAIPELEEVAPLTVGQHLTAIAKEDPTIQRDLVKGKPYYSKV
jgi:hypothetical protein